MSRVVIAPDRVQYTARCPCGYPDATWVSLRKDLYHAGERMVLGRTETVLLGCPQCDNPLKVPR